MSSNTRYNINNAPASSKKGSQGQPQPSPRPIVTPQGSHFPPPKNPNSNIRPITRAMLNTNKEKERPQTPSHNSEKEKEKEQKKEREKEKQKQKLKQLDKQRDSLNLVNVLFSTPAKQKEKEKEKESSESEMLILKPIAQQKKDGEIVDLTKDVPSKEPPEETISFDNVNISNKKTGPNPNKNETEKKKEKEKEKPVAQNPAQSDPMPQFLPNQMSLMDTADPPAPPPTTLLSSEEQENEEDKEIENETRLLELEKERMEKDEEEKKRTQKKVAVEGEDEEEEEVQEGAALGGSGTPSNPFDNDPNKATQPQLQDNTGGDANRNDNSNLDQQPSPPPSPHPSAHDDEEEDEEEKEEDMNLDREEEEELGRWSLMKKELQVNKYMIKVIVRAIVKDGESSLGCVAPFTGIVKSALKELDPDLDEGSCKRQGTPWEFAVSAKRCGAEETLKKWGVDLSSPDWYDPKNQGASKFSFDFGKYRLFFAPFYKAFPDRFRVFLSGLPRDLNDKRFHELMSKNGQIISFGVHMQNVTRENFTGNTGLGMVTFVKAEDASKFIHIASSGSIKMHGKRIWA